ncbi:pseudouridine synthase [Pseudoramibacter sp.]|jgi:pseudouridine synthase|uniref:pseudouridine synthase n=1 Tax=Pseudoramibacter sp. TaxID=2034862 RepID=UPI0025F0C319|nr:pseudouridine synthase [Pseudoramibacter sp.]MCH4072640.1 rRNA pseudouridine synthase [Pseudoramibacter sp.]MCH4106411.1 rRNA pseudouridine synthase [Pseudoramibacter sp.]
MRLQKYLAHCGVASRRKSESIIAEGRVQVNGQVVLFPGTQVNEGDQVLVDHKKIAPEEDVYILLNKPKGVVSTSSDKHASQTLMDLIHTDKRLYSVGRLDKETTGLLILTNDGDLTFKLTHPSRHVTKTYRCTVQGKVSKAALQQLRSGPVISLDDGTAYKTQRARAEVIKENRGSTVLEIRISEGKKRQVRKMCAAVGHPVIHLERTAIGSLTDPNLAPGKWRYLTKEEIIQLKAEH